MFDMMTQSKNAIEVYNSALGIHNANIANLSVPGYKSLDMSFQSILEHLLTPGTSASDFSYLGGTNPKQLGQGVGIGNISVNFSQGEQTDGEPINLSIIGQGLFIVSDDGGNTFQYTRAGTFTKDANNNLVTASGMQVYGLNGSGSIAPITGLTGGVSEYSWNDSGELLLNGASTGYKIALTYFNNSSGLQQASGTTFKATASSGDAHSPVGPGGMAGTVSPGKVEQSNVFYTGESIAALELQRAVNANLNAVKAASDLISSFISKLG